MKLLPGEVHAAIQKISEASGSLNALLMSLNNMKIGAFSEVSGLDESGAMHGSIRGDSEPEATRGLAQHFNNAVGLLSAQLVGYQMADQSFAEVLGTIGQTVRGGGYRALVDNVKTDDPVVNAFDATNPVAGRPSSLEALNAQLIATDVASMTGMSADWANTAATIGEALAYIPAAIGDLQGSAETESIARAIEHLGQVEAAGTQYMGNASALSAHTASLATVAEANAVQAAAALAVVRGTPSAGVAKALEESFLAAFSPKLTTELVPATPLFTQLLPELGAPNGAGTNQSGALAPTAPTFENTPLPKIVQQALSNAGYRDLAYASTPAQVIEQFGRPNPDMLESIAAGATPTQAASASAPALPPTLTGGSPGGVSGPVAAHPTAGLGQMPAVSLGPSAGLTNVGNGTAAAPVATAGVAGVGTPASAAPGTSPRGIGRGTTAPGFTRALPGAAAAGHPRPLSGLGSPAGAGALGGSAGRGSAGVTLGSGSTANSLSQGRMAPVPVGGVGAGSGTGAGPNAGMGMQPGPGAAVQGGNTLVTGGQAGNGHTNGRGTMAGGPGMYGAGQRSGGNKKRGKVQAVTSAVEREGNLKALLGEAPEVVPGVIGAWVRQPRT